MKKTFSILTISAFLFSCGGNSIDVDSNPINADEITNVDNVVLNGNTSINNTIDGKIFSIPSPVQMSLLLKEEVGMFNEEMTSDPATVSKYATTHKKALNMGVYGADLGYSTIFENNTKAVSYLASIEKLADDLGISGAFDESLINRFIDNGNNQDSMLVIMSDGYRAGDKFLKNNKQHDVATLILTGGWIESLFYATSSYPHKQNQEIANRIGEQKSTLLNIIELLEIYNQEGYYEELVLDLKNLKIEFDAIEFSYKFIESETNEELGETTLKGETSVVININTMQSIIEKVEDIRNSIIN